MIHRTCTIALFFSYPLLRLFLITVSGSLAWSGCHGLLLISFSESKDHNYFTAAMHVRLDVK